MIPDRYAGFILGKNGSRIQKTASKSGCKACVFLFVCFAVFFLGGIVDAFGQSAATAEFFYPPGLDDIKKWLTGSARDHHWELQVPRQTANLNFPRLSRLLNWIPTMIQLCICGCTYKKVLKRHHSNGPIHFMRFMSLLQIQGNAKWLNR